MRAARLSIGLLLILVALGGLYVLRHHNSQIPPAKHGAPAPDFALPKFDGGEIRLSSYKGKVVLLDFWATWCDPCREEIPSFVGLQQKYGDRGLQIIGVSMDDSPDPVRAFYQQFHMNYPAVMGTAATGEAYGGVLGLPIAFLIDREGRIYSKHIGATDPAIFEKEVATLLQTR